MLVFRIHSGLGNQMLQYAFAKTFSQQRVYFQFGSPNRLHPFSVKIKKKSKITSILHSLLFNLIYKEVHDPIWQQIDPKTIKPYTLVEGYWGFPAYFNHLRTHLIQDFQIAKPSSEYLKAVSYVKSKRTVAIHVRRGDYLEPRHVAIFNTLGVDYYQKGMTHLEKNQNIDGYMVFSNDIDWCKAHFKSEKPIEFINDLFALTDYEEMHVMANCSHIIIANSTFSWWSAYLNTNPQKVIIRPKKWYNLEVAQKAYEETGMADLDGSVAV